MHAACTGHSPSPAGLQSQLLLLLLQGIGPRLQHLKLPRAWKGRPLLRPGYVSLLLQ